MNLYRNITDQEQAVIGFGVVKPGQVVKTGALLENPNFELVQEEAAQATPTPPQVDQPANQNQE